MFAPLLSAPKVPLIWVSIHAVQGMPKSVRNARIACLDMNLQKARMHFGVQVCAPSILLL